MNKLYIESNTGISGDMFVAALLDLGAAQNRLFEALESISELNFKIKISKVKKAGIEVCDFDVILPAHMDNHDHDMEYLYSHNNQTYAVEQEQHADSSCHEHVHHHHTESHEHAHQHADSSCHEHAHHHHTESHEHAHQHVDSSCHEHAHHHVHRTLADILDIIENTSMSDNAKKIANKIFTILGEAEAKAHGYSINDVHFHEVGAVDSIVDIIAAAVCLDDLNITDVIIPYLTEGYGTVRCAHGILSVPVPAVCNIIEKHGIRIRKSRTKGELVTPTGAAIAAAIMTENTEPEMYIVKKIGLGGGKRSYKIPSILRVMLIDDEKEKASEQKDSIYKLETNIDDCTGENLGYVMEQLLEKGALDVFYTPIFMKKNRPAYQLSVLCEEKSMRLLEDFIFEKTTTLGVRRVKMTRSILQRKIEKIETSLGEAIVKVCAHNGTTKYYPEYESVAQICRHTELSFDEVYRIIQSEAGGK